VWKGNRSPRAIARAPFRRGHYRGLLGAFRFYGKPRECLWRYLTARGEYPYAPRLKTPLGTVAPTLDTSHDMSTVHEIFAREDYAAGHDLRLAVDVGGNIGISALYFLTRSPESRVIIFEPNPRNVARLRKNLDAFSDRYELHESAIGLANGQVDFTTEWTGRYGRVSSSGPDTIRVSCLEINDVLKAIVGERGPIDLLKIDVEGLEGDLVASLEPDLLGDLRVIYYETVDPEPLHPDHFAHSFSLQTNRLVARRPGRTVARATAN
jgi:FkbM family methyltransferase